MSRFANLPGPSFGRRAPSEGLAPAATLRAPSARRTAMLHEAAAALGVLPSPGEALHALVTGRYDLMHLLVVLLGRLGPARHVRIATLSYSRRNLGEMLRMLDGPAPPRLTLLCSSFFRDHNKPLWSETLRAFRERGQRAAAARTHAKVIALELASGARLAVEGSANLRSNGNREQILVANDAGLHDWHATWIDQLVTLHEGDGDGEG